MSKLLSNLGVSTIVTDSTKQSKTLSIPHMKPFEAIELIRTQTSSPSGQKMFVYGTLSQGVIIDSLDKMLERKPMESMFRYEVGESPLNPDDINEKISILARTIHKVTVADSIDALAMVKDGFFGVRNNSIDMFNKTMVTTNYGSGSGLVEQGDAPRVNSVTNSSVSSLGWDMGEDRYTRAKNHSSFTLENLLVSPYMFRGLSTIGHAITVVFPNNTYNVEGDSPFDLKRSGEFIITHSRLSIKPGKATFTMNAVSKVRNNV
jgi:phage pi2 protein 07